MNRTSSLTLALFVLTTGALAQECPVESLPLACITSSVSEAYSEPQAVEARGAQVTFIDRLGAASKLVFNPSGVLENWPEYIYLVQAGEFGRLCNNTVLGNVDLGTVAAVVSSEGSGNNLAESIDETFRATGIALPPAPLGTAVAQGIFASWLADPEAWSLRVDDLCHWVEPTLVVSDNQNFYLVTSRLIPDRDLDFAGRAHVVASQALP